MSENESIWSSLRKKYLKAKEDKYVVFVFTLVVGFLLGLLAAKSIGATTAITSVISISLTTLLLTEMRNRSRLQNKQLEFMRIEHESKKQAIEEMSGRLESWTVLPQITEAIGQRLKEGLTASPEWLTEAIETAHLYPYANTEFRERSTHHRDEKEFLAYHASQALFIHAIEKAKVLKEKYIYILVDSGSTLSPLLAHLGALAKSARSFVNEVDGKTEWLGYGREDVDAAISKIRFVTNSLSGVQKYMASARMNDHYHYDTAMYCFLLNGYPQVSYASVAGRHTNRALRNLVVRHREASRDPSRADADAWVISVTTGNFIGIDVKLGVTDDSAVRPIPFARGRGHLTFKMNLVNIANEVIVVSPLAKVLPPTLNVDRFNELQDFDHHRRNVYWHKRWAVFLDDVPPDAMYEPYPFRYEDDVDLGDQKTAEERVAMVMTYVKSPLTDALNIVKDPTSGKPLARFESRPLRNYKYAAIPRVLFDVGPERDKYAVPGRKLPPPRVVLMTTDRPKDSKLRALSGKISEAYRSHHARVRRYSLPAQSEPKFHKDLAASLARTDLIMLRYHPNINADKEEHYEYPRLWENRKLLDEWLSE